MTIRALVWSLGAETICWDMVSLVHVQAKCVLYRKIVYLVMGLERNLMSFISFHQKDWFISQVTMV